MRKQILSRVPFKLESGPHRPKRRYHVVWRATATETRRRHDGTERELAGEPPKFVWTGKCREFVRGRLSGAFTRGRFPEV